MKHDAPDNVALERAGHPDQRNRHSATVRGEIAFEADGKRSRHEPAGNQEHGGERNLRHDNGGAKPSAAALGNRARIPAKHEHVDGLKGVPRWSEGEECRGNARQTDHDRDERATDPRVEHRRLFGTEERGKRARQPPRQQQSEHRTAERDRQAFDHDLTDQCLAARAQRELDGELTAPGRAPRQQQAAGIHAGAEQQETRGTEHHHTDQQHLTPGRGIEPRVPGRGEPARLSIVAARAPVGVGKLARQARSRGVELARGVSQIGAVPEPPDNRQPAIAAGHRRKRLRQGNPHIGRPPQLQAVEARWRDRRNRVFDAPISSGRPIGSAGAPSAFHNPSLMTAGGTGPVAGRLTAPPIPIAGKNSGDTDTTRTRCDRSPRRTTVTCESSKAASDWNAGTACFIERKSG